MRFHHFLACALAGTAAWAVAFCALGYAFYRSISTVADVLTGAGLALLAAGVVAYLLVRRARARSSPGAPPRPRGAA
jgi:membrane protein DedA with SNARE-associated domain